MKQLIQLLLAMFRSLFRRGQGIFKLLFVIDNFFRVFTMTLLIPIFFNWLKFNTYLISMGAILGLVIDIHDYYTDLKFTRR